MFKIKKNTRYKKVCAILLAAGKGTRMGSDIKKQYISVCGYPLIYYSLDTLSKCSLVDRIILVVGEDDIVTVNEIIREYNFNKVSHIVVGGKERMHSVYNGLKEAEEFDYVLVHDGARPLISKEDVENVIKDAFIHKAATLGVKVKDTIKKADENKIVKETLKREELYIIQTPQVIERNLLLEGYANSKDKIFTDDTSIVENIGKDVKITEGSYSNIKVTTIDDLRYVESFLSEEEN